MPYWLLCGIELSLGLIIALIIFIIPSSLLFLKRMPSKYTWVYLLGFNFGVWFEKIVSHYGFFK